MVKPENFSLIYPIRIVKPISTFALGQSRIWHTKITYIDIVLFSHFLGRHGLIGIEARVGDRRVFVVAQAETLRAHDAKGFVVTRIHCTGQSALEADAFYDPKVRHAVFSGERN